LCLIIADGRLGGKGIDRASPGRQAGRHVLLGAVEDEEEDSQREGSQQMDGAGSYRAQRTAPSLRADRSRMKPNTHSTVKQKHCDQGEEGAVLRLMLAVYRGGVAASDEKWCGCGVKARNAISGFAGWPLCSPSRWDRRSFLSTVMFGKYAA